MQKSKLTNAIQRYYLAGNCNAVKWIVENSDLKISFMTDSKTLLGNMTVKNIGISDGEFGIYDTDQLLRMLSPLDSEVSYEYSNGFQGVDGIIFNDNSIRAHYLFADLSVIPETSNLMYEPEPNLTFEVNKEFIDKFVKAKSALSDSNIFAIEAGPNSSKIIMNYSTHRTNRMEIQIPKSELHTPMDIIAFNADLFKEVLVANKDSKSGTIKVSADGLLIASFIGEDYESNYYVVKMDIA